MSYNSSFAHSIAEQLTIAIDNKRIDVPILPTAAQQVISITQDPDSDATQLAKVIQSDPTLSGHVMRISNSAAYTPNSNLISLQQAITRLGMVEISNIALSTSLNSKMFKAPGYEEHIEYIWKHALMTAIWSKEIARKLRTNVEAAFLCGLLHCIGKAVILQTISDFRTTSDSVMGNYDLQTLFKQHESQVSQVVAIEWGLPEIITEAITYYNNFKDAPSCAEIAAIVLFGHQTASHTLDPDNYSRDDLNNSDALDLVNLYPEEVDELLEQTETLNASMEALLV